MAVTEPMLLKMVVAAEKWLFSFWRQISQNWANRVLAFLFSVIEAKFASFAYIERLTNVFNLALTNNVSNTLYRAKMETNRDERKIKEGRKALLKKKNSTHQINYITGKHLLQMDHIPKDSRKQVPLVC
jgi:hypothetical protein